jgi:hypothetical protein
MRLKVEQTIVLRQRRAEERKEKGLREYNRINDLVKAGKDDEALADTEKALVAFQDSPPTTRLLRNMRLHLLLTLPGRLEEGFRLANEEAVQAKMSQSSMAMISVAAQLLNAAEATAPGRRDQRLINLALVLIRDPSHSDLRGQPEHFYWDCYVGSQHLLGWAYHLRGDAARATEAIRDAIALVRGLKPPAGADEKQFAETAKQQLKDLEATLKEYSGKATSPKGNQR